MAAVDTRPAPAGAKAPYHLDIPGLQGLLSQLEAVIRAGAPAWQLAELCDARGCTVNLIARARLEVRS
jgi:hypothetical protein